MSGENEQIKRTRIKETVYHTDSALKETGTSLICEMANAMNNTTDDGVHPEERIFDHKGAMSLKSILEKHTGSYNETGLTREELKDKRESLLQEMMGFEVLHFEKSAEERAREKESITQKREEKARTLQIPRTLYSSSREQKSRILKTLKLDEITRKNLMQEEKSLEEILHTHMSTEEQRRAAKDGKKFLKLFRKTRDEMNRNPLLTAEEKARRLYRLAKPYETAVVLYREEYFNTLKPSNRYREIETLLDRITRFYELYSGNGSEEERQQIREEMDIQDLYIQDLETEELKQGRKELLTRIQRRTRKIDKSEAKESDASQDGNLNSEQIAGIEAVDRFIIEQGNTSGGNMAFVDKILKLSLRDRLLLYGLIEKKREAAPSASDIAITQIGYVPDPAVFASRMSRLPGCLWAGDKGRRFASHFTNMRWEKLEAAMEYMGQAGVQEVRDAFAKLSGAKAADIQDFREMADQKLEDPKNQTEHMVLLTEREMKRNQQLLSTIGALEKCRDAMIEAEKSVFHRKSKKAKADDLVNNAKAEIEKLENLDRALFNTMSSIREYAESQMADEGLLPDWYTKDKLDTEIKTKPPGDSTAKKVIGASVFAGSQSTMLMSKMDKVVSIFNGGNAPSAFGFASGSFLSLSGVIGLIGGFMGAAKVVTTIHDKGSSIASSDITNMIAKSARTLGASAWGVLAGGYQIGLVSAGMVAAKKVADGALETAKVMKDNIDIATDALSLATIAVSSAKLGVDAFDAGVQFKHAIHHGVASYRVHKLEKKEVLKGDEAAYADNILKIDMRNKRREFIETANSAAISCGAILATIIGGPVVPLAYAGAAAVNAVAMKIYMKASKLLDIKAMVDEFLQLDSITKQAFPEYSTFDVVKKAKAKARIKEEMMAELGYVSNAAFSKHIAKNYAEFIYNKLFFVNDDHSKPLLKKNDDEKKLTDISLACYQMVKSLGLRVVFPKDAGGNRYPTPQMIAAKLLG